MPSMMEQGGGRVLWTEEQKESLGRPKSSRGDAGIEC